MTIDPAQVRVGAYALPLCLWLADTHSRQQFHNAKSPDPWGSGDLDPIGNVVGECALAGRRCAGSTAGHSARAGSTHHRLLRLHLP